MASSPRSPILAGARPEERVVGTIYATNGGSFCSVALTGNMPLSVSVYKVQYSRNHVSMSSSSAFFFNGTKMSLDTISDEWLYVLSSCTFFTSSSAFINFNVQFLASNVLRTCHACCAKCFEM